MGPGTPTLKIKECNFKRVPYFEVWRCELPNKNWKFANKLYKTMTKTNAEKFIKKMEGDKKDIFENKKYKPHFDGTRILLVDNGQS